MKETEQPLQRLVKREVVLTLISIVLAVLYQTLWYVAPDLLAYPLWSGSMLTVSFVLGSFAILAPIFTAYLIACRDVVSDEVYETSDH